MTSSTFTFIGMSIDHFLDWLNKNTICKLSGHKWKWLTGSFPQEAYCDRCGSTRKLVDTEMYTFNWLMSQGPVDMNTFELFLRGKMIYCGCPF